MLVRQLAALAVASLVAAATSSPTTAQVVQLPSYSYTTIGTTVSVPDGGAAYLGGVYRSSEGSTTRGVPLTPLKNRAIGRSTGASTMSVHATIIDLAEMDEALLAEAASKRAAAPYGPYRVDSAVAAEASFLDAHVGRGAGAASRATLPSGAVTLPQSSRLTPAAPHAAATVHASAAQKSSAAADLADRLFKSEVQLGKGTSEEASQP
ncbi:MAG TPA: hypothetical protein VGN57_05660 [Pirellulaceae bacterium]|nr:hypothetical protein [Pirellulaceae bacterium]